MSTDLTHGFAAEAKQLNANHARLKQVFVEVAIANGAILRRIRDELKPKGLWIAWVNNNCHFTVRYAQMYISISQLPREQLEREGITTVRAALDYARDEGLTDTKRATNASKRGCETVSHPPSLSSAQPQRPVSPPAAPSPRAKVYGVLVVGPMPRVGRPKVSIVYTGEPKNAEVIFAVPASAIMKRLRPLMKEVHEQGKVHPARISQGGLVTIASEVMLVMKSWLEGKLAAGWNRDDTAEVDTEDAAPSSASDAEVDALKRENAQLKQQIAAKEEQITALKHEGKLSETQTEKLDRYKIVLDAEFEARSFNERAQCMKYLEGKFITELEEKLPREYVEKLKQAEKVIASDKRPFTVQEYNALVKTAHPDNSASAETRNEAARLLKERKSLLVRADDAEPLDDDFFTGLVEKMFNDATGRKRRADDVQIWVPSFFERYDLYAAERAQRREREDKRRREEEARKRQKQKWQAAKKQ
jgi:hypothetical protein